MGSQKNLVIEKIEEWATIIFFYSSMFVLILLVQAQVLTWLNQFKILYLSFSVLTALIISTFSLRIIKKDIRTLPRLNIWALVIILVVSFILIFFPHDTLGGRDEGMYANISVYLANHATLNVPSYLDNTQLMVEQSRNIPPTYIAWLALQKTFLGIQGLLRGNLIIIILGLCSFFLVSSHIGGRRIGLIATILFSSSMPFLWFMRETMTENLSFFLLWVSIVFLFTFFKTKKYYYLTGVILGTWLFSFTRLEGLLIQFTTFLAFLFIIIFTKTFNWKNNLLIILIYISVIGSTLLIYHNFSYDAYLQSVAKTAERVLVQSSPTTLVENIIKQNSGIIHSDVALRDRIPIFVFQMLSKYNLVLILLSIFLISPLIFINKKINKLFFFSMLFIISPEFLKLVDPAVTMEQPWLYRRYVYSLLPLGYLCFSLLLNRTNSRRLLFLLTGILLIINIVLSNKIIFLKNNWFVTEKIEKLTKNVSKDDVVIIDSEDLLMNYYPTNFLTFNKSILTLYYNWANADRWLPEEKRIQRFHYKKLFLLSDKELPNYNGFNLSKVDSVEIIFKQLDPNCKLRVLKLNLRFGKDLYFLPYQDVINYCSKTDNEILEIKREIFLYELIYESNQN